MIKVTVIIPVFNVEQYIGQCIDSVTLQDYPNIECLIINDCSTDNSISILENKIKKYQGSIQFSILHQDKNRGAAAARNLGIQKASGDYIYFLDSDDEIYANCLQTMTQFAVHYPGVDLVQGDVICENTQLTNELSIGNKNFPEFSDDRKWIDNNFFVSLPVPPWNKLIRTSLLKDCNLFFQEGIVNEDVLWFFKMRTSVSSIAFSMVKTYFHRFNHSSVMNSPQNEKKRTISYVFILKELIANINDETRYIDNFGILKQFQHNRLLETSDSNKSFFKQEFDNCIHLALKSEKVPFVFKPMYSMLYLPTGIFKKTLFLWNKGLGILYRLSKS